MLPSPSSSPAQTLEDCTNILPRPIPFRLPAYPLTPPDDKILKRRLAFDHLAIAEKRVRLDLQDEHINTPTSEGFSDSDSDVEMDDVAVTRIKSRRTLPFEINKRSLTRPNVKTHQCFISTRPILRSFVSSHKSDVFKCQSNDANAYLTPPYACAYTHDAKRGGKPVLAISTEQGSVHILDTRRRSDWDPEPPRTTLQVHNNGIFDTQWSIDDTRLATCSGDQSTRITCSRTNDALYVLRGHISTVKCIAWDPSHGELLSTGGRDGSLLLWDLRTPGKSNGEGVDVLDPVMTISGVHEDIWLKGKPRGRKRKTTPVPRSVTNLLYPENGPYGLITSGSFDGILRYWDLRTPTTSRKSKISRSKIPTLNCVSSVDPTTLHSSRRPRGIISLTQGSGPTAGLVFGLGADSRIHTYDLPSLTIRQNSLKHENMQTNSFYIGLSLSPCGRWLASGSVGARGSTFLFDVSNVAGLGRPVRKPEGVELSGQMGEVGAVDWAQDTLATCADDGTVRIWRPDVATYRACIGQPEENKWEWCWAISDRRINYCN